jgi:predicted transcriptional regulator
METVFKLTNAETKLAELIWSNEPIASMQLVKLANAEYRWSKSTTFTHLKAIIEKGLAKNENSCAAMLYTRDEIVAKQSCRYVDDAFGGSLPMFVAAFTSNRKLSPEQVAQLKTLIDEHEGGRKNG